MNSGDKDTITPLTWEYIAGFFDGEGCIFYTTEKYRKGVSHYVLLSVTQGIKNNQGCHIIERIHDFLSEHGIKNGITHFANPTNTIRIQITSGASARDTLNGLLPYLTVKRAKAIEAIDFINNQFLFLWTSPPQQQAILDLRAKGYGIRRIGNALNIHRGTAKNILIKHGMYTTRMKAGRIPSVSI